MIKPLASPVFKTSYWFLIATNLGQSCFDFNFDTSRPRLLSQDLFQESSVRAARSEEFFELPDRMENFLMDDLSGKLHSV